MAERRSRGEGGLSWNEARQRWTSKADQAVRLLASAGADEAMRAYVVVSLLTGARTEELRGPDLDARRSRRRAADRSAVALGTGPGETKTRQSRRTLELPARAVEALRVHRTSQLHAQLAVGERWQSTGLVFCTSVGTALDAANVRRVAAAAGLDAQEWTPRELRHSFASLLSSTGMSIEDISCPTSTSGPADLAVERRPKRRDPPSGRRLPR